MGAVYVARDLLLKRNVAVKMILPHLGSDPSAVKRLLREAVTTARLEHRNIARVYTAGSDAEERVYIVQELLAGRTLEHELAIWLPPPRLSLRRFFQMLEGLQIAHRNEIVHRDIKPSNIFLARDYLDERTVVLDFGVAKETAANRLHSTVTHAGSIIGTVHYMSPEQAHGEADVDASADVWSAGVVLYEMLTRDVPLLAPTLPALMLKIINDPIPDVRATSPSVIPASLANVLAKALERDRGKRFRNAGEFLRALQSVDLRSFDHLTNADARAPTAEEWARIHPRICADHQSLRLSGRGDGTFLRDADRRGYPQSVVNVVRWSWDIGLVSHTDEQREYPAPRIWIDTRKEMLIMGKPVRLRGADADLTKEFFDALREVGFVEVWPGEWVWRFLRETGGEYRVSSPV